MLGVLILGVRDERAAAVELDAFWELLGECLELAVAGALIVLKYRGHIRVKASVARLIALQLAPIKALAPLV